MKNLSELVNERYSCRAYDATRQPEREKLEHILECARLAPSATNRQPWRFIAGFEAMSDAESVRKVREAVLASYNRPWIESAPGFFIICGVEDDCWVRPFDGHSHLDIDCAICTEHMCLAATDCGLGSCWVCNFDPEILRRELDLPANIRPVVILPVGYPATDAVPEKKRKPLEELIIKI